eukprot:scaffold175734_cov28-Tisochrysis_lutea.AAC.4
MKKSWKRSSKSKRNPPMRCTRHVEGDGPPRVALAMSRRVALAGQETIRANLQQINTNTI